MDRLSDDELIRRMIAAERAAVACDAAIDARFAKRRHGSHDFLLGLLPLYANAETIRRRVVTLRAEQDRRHPSEHSATVVS